MTGSALPPVDVEAQTPADRAAPFPWPPAESDSVTAALRRTWRASVFEPGAFFRGLPVTGATGPALIYYFIVGMALATVEFFWQLTFALAIGTVAYLTDLYQVLGLKVDAISPLIAFLLSPLILTVTLILSFAIVHGLLWFLGGARRGPATTLRVLCYAYSPRAFGVVPVIGSWIGVVWMLVTAIIGLREAHATDGWRAAVAVLLPFALFLAAVAALIVLVALVIGIAA